MKKKLSVIIPSRDQPQQVEFISRAVASIASQSLAEEFDTHVFIGIDSDSSLDLSATNLAIQPTIVRSHGNSQASALNGCISKLDSDYAAFLEDDDTWQIDYLQIASQALGAADFVSSTQAEYRESGTLLRINDFATPSGWIMHASTLNAVGCFNEAFKLHLDNEWLGRLSRQHCKRIHLVESTAPIEPAYVMSYRPGLFNILQADPGHSYLFRHSNPYPLVNRLVHNNSGMSKISEDSTYKQISESEHRELINIFKKTPW